MKLKLYTCSSGKWLHDDHDSFTAWDENEWKNHVATNDVHIFEVDEIYTVKKEYEDCTIYRVHADDIEFDSTNVI